MTTEFHLKTGDRLPILTDYLTDDAGPLDLSGATVGLRVWKRETGAKVTLTGTGAVVDAATGQVSWTWSAADATALQTAGPGLYDYEWALTYAGGVRTVPQSGRGLPVLEASLA